MLVDSAWNSAWGNVTHFFFKNVDVLPTKAAKLENLGQNFSEMSFEIYNRKSGKCWNQIFFTGSWQELCVWYKLCKPLILVLWLVTLPCLLTEIAQILQKVIVFCLERGEEIKPWFWHIWIAQRLKFFYTDAYFFFTSAIFRGKQWKGGGGKVGPKILSFGPSFSIKFRILQKNFQANFFFARVLPLVRISAKGIGCWIGMEILNLATTNAILMKLTAIMYLYEKVNRKALRATNLIFWPNFLDRIKNVTYVMYYLALHHW